MQVSMDLQEVEILFLMLGLLLGLIVGALASYVDTRKP